MAKSLLEKAGWRIIYLAILTGQRKQNFVVQTSEQKSFSA
jgi:hypothetical protein